MTVYILAAVCGAALLAVVLLLAHMLLVKKQLRIMRQELALTRQEHYNRQLTVTLIDNDVTELCAELNRNLDYQKQLKLKSEQSELALKQSVSDIAHDLRTPLTVIRGNLQMLAAGEQLSEKGREYLRISSDKTDTIKQMAEDFFELSVLESDSAAPTLVHTDLTASLVDFILASEAAIRCNGTEPEIQLPEKSVFVLAEPSMLQRMLSNLLSNTLKHGGGSFLLSLTESEDECTISFENKLKDGAQPDASQLFNRTYRGDKSRSGSGAGLGLYIVKLLAQKQNAAAVAQMNDGRLCISIVFKK